MSKKYIVSDEAVFQVDDTSFTAVVIIDGEGTITVLGTILKTITGDTFFIHAGKKEVCVKGKCEFILTHV